MSKSVFLAYWCNNDGREDYSEHVEAVFSTMEKAIAFIEGNGYSLRTKVNDLYVKKGVKRWDKVVDEYKTHSMWVREMAVD